MISRTNAQSNVITNIGAGRFELKQSTVIMPKGNSSKGYLQLFNKANGIPGTDLPDGVIMLPLNSTPDGQVIKKTRYSGSTRTNVFDTGLSYAFTTGPTNAVDVGAANRPFVQIDYDGSSLGGAV